MSDDEMPPVGGDDFDGDDDDIDMDYKPPAELPEGVKKEIITEAPEGNYKKPKPGDEVHVHYVGTLESDGSEFDSSRSRGKEFTFSLGKGAVIKGWDLGVATMKKGEVAKFTLAPEFAYGASGSPPKIPENATLIFEVELLKWDSKDDLFGDEGVIKTQLTEGSGWKTPKAGDEVLMSYKATAIDGTVIEEKEDITYKIGSETLGSIAKACDKALTGMKKGETAELKCTKEYAYEDKPDGATISITLNEMYETKDVSFGKDGSLMKKQVKEGEGWDTPKDTSKIRLSVDVATDGTTPLPGFTPKVLEFSAGDGEVCDALEFAVTEMKKGEKAVLTVTKPAMAKEAQLGIGDISAEQVVLIVEMLEFEKAKETWDMSEEQKVEFGTARKEVGSALFKQGRLAMALQRYKKVGDLFSYIDNFKEENKTKAKELKKACELNKAACYLKLKDFVEAKTACNAVLKEEKQHVKALYRRAQAENGLKNFLEAISDCKTIIQIDSQNKEARSLWKEAQAGQKEVDKQAKGLFANMCKALGKGPIPEPGKAKRPFEDEDDDEDMEGGAGDDGGNNGDAEEKPAETEAAAETAAEAAAPAAGEESATTATA